MVEGHASLSDIYHFLSADSILFILFHIYIYLYRLSFDQSSSNNSALFLARSRVSKRRVRSSRINTYDTYRRIRGQTLVLDVDDGIEDSICVRVNIYIYFVTSDFKFRGKILGDDERRDIAPFRNRFAPLNPFANATLNK